MGNARSESDYFAAAAFSRLYAVGVTWSADTVQPHARLCC
jgi:hypothetical protein